MDKEDFYKDLKSNLNKLNVDITIEQSEQFYKYMHLLQEWNEKINLTAIIEDREIILKHFIDSLTILKYIKDEDKVIDIGTGAGFPGVPVKIANKNVKITLLDSLNKRIIFLNEVIKELDLKSISAIHSRAEDIAIISSYREQYDIVTSRAVANLSTLLEYMLPFCKVNGICICMKGSNTEEELKNCKKALEILGGKIENIENMILPDSDIERNIIIIRKIKETPKNYPRKSGKPSKEPLS